MDVAVTVKVRYSYTSLRAPEKTVVAAAAAAAAAAGVVVVACVRLLVVLVFSALDEALLRAWETLCVLDCVGVNKILETCFGKHKRQVCKRAKIWTTSEAIEENK